MRDIVDFHCHILPGIDDGSADPEESVAMLREEAAQGIGHVVATPHFYPRHDTVSGFLKKREEAEARLRDALAGDTALPKISVGAEVYYFPGISEFDGLEALTVGGTACVLLEMPATPWSQSMYREIENIHSKQGLLPIIAHVDRYIRPFSTHGIPERLQELPVFVQANAAFFLNGFTGPMALRMLRQDQIQLLGSDCHNMHSRKPDMGRLMDLLERRCPEELIHRICSYQEDVFGAGR